MEASREVVFVNEQSALELDMGLFEKIAERTLDYAGITGSVTVLFAGHEKITEINSRYLNRDKSTDVISFPYEEPDLAGEIMVNTERALDESGGETRKAIAETALYMVHGILHLGDFDDLDPEKAPAMHEAEDEILGEFGIEVA